MATYTINTAFSASTDNAGQTSYTFTGNTDATLAGTSLSVRDETLDSGGGITGSSNILSTPVGQDGSFSFSVGASSLSAFNQFAVTDGSGSDSSTFVNNNSGSTLNQTGGHELKVNESSGTVIDGYLAGAKVFIDTNNNGVLDPGEQSTTADVAGNFSLLNASGGQIVSVGGTDTLTGLTFTGTLTAPSGASVVTPITTLVNQVAQLNGGDVAAAQKAVATALGLSNTLNLVTLDPIQATLAGTAGASSALAASAQLINTAKLVSATGASGDAFKSIASAIVSGGGTVDLTNASTVASIAAAAGANSAAAAAVGQIAAASNTAVSQAVTTNAGNPSALLNTVGSISQVAQGTTASAVTSAGSDTTKLAQVVVANTGSSLTNEIAGATVGTSSSGVVTGAATNNVASEATQSLQNFLNSVFDNVGTVPVTYIGGTGSGTVTANLDNGVGVVTPGTNASIHASTDAALLVSGGSTVDLSSSAALNTAGRHLGIAVQLGDGNNTLTLNKGPSSAQSSDGNDTIISSGGFDTLKSGFGSDSLVGGGHSQLFGGSVAGDTLQGGLAANSHDTLTAGIGGDLITTAAGRNIIYGNENDTIRAGFAHDTIIAGYGSETIQGGLGSTVFGGGSSVMKGGNHDIYNATGADTIYGSNHANTVNITDGSNGVTIDATTGTGAMTVNVNTTNHGNDTLFGGINADGSGSNLTIHVSQSFTEQTKLDANGLHVLHLAGGQTLHVSNVTIDFNGTKTSI